MVQDPVLHSQSKTDDALTLPLIIDGVKLEGGTLQAFMASYIRREGILGDIARFLKAWHSPTPVLAVQSSGSTGEPKIMNIAKRKMIISAKRTCDYLQLRKGQSVLLAMPMRYIAAKMVVVRAMVQGLNLIAVQPSSSPLRAVNKKLDCIILTSMQAFESLNDPQTRKKLLAAKTILIGGGSISHDVAEQFASFPNAVWSSYGMTETLSHIALRRLSGPNASDAYTPLPGISVRLAPDGTLAIWDPQIVEGELITHDLVDLCDDGTFKIVGRCDNVINSGGIKVQLEAVEELLAPLIKHPFCVTAVPDERLGEKLVMLYTGTEGPDILLNKCRNVLPKYWVPRNYLHTHAIPLTETGKIARISAKELAIKLLALRSKTHTEY